MNFQQKVRARKELYKIKSNDFMKLINMRRKYTKKHEYMWKLYRCIYI